MSDFNFQNLTNDVREFMIEEINSDIEKGVLYVSSRLNATGKEKYPSFLINAAKSGNDATFQKDLQSSIHFNPTYLRQGKPVKMPSNSAELLAQGEFNRFYIRGICRKAIVDGIETVEVYRARHSSWSRPESEMKIGKSINAKDLLRDLRNSVGEQPQMLPEVNSGLSVKF